MSQSTENDAPRRRTICPHPSYHNVCDACVREDRARSDRDPTGQSEQSCIYLLTILVDVYTALLNLRIDVASLKAIRTIQVGELPWGITISQQ